MGDEGRDILGWLKLNSRSCRIEILQPFTDQDLCGFDLVFRSPGVWRRHPRLIEADKHGVRILSASQLFLALCPARTIGVTGTKGKGTTTTLIAKILQAAGKRVFVAGNIGRPMLALLPRLKPGDWVCLELSSFQLQDLNRSPHIAVVLDIRRDHLDVHAGVREYRRAKSNIIRRQRPADYAVLNADYSLTRRWARLTRGKVRWFSGKKLTLDPSRVKLRGSHNRENIAAALTVAGIIGIDPELAAITAQKFPGLEHRLELVRRIGGVAWYNDSFSTTPETAIAAIRSFSEPLTLILGGSEKGSDYRELGRIISRATNIVNLILIGKTAIEIKSAVQGYAGNIVTGLKDMEAIVSVAAGISPPGSAVVLSPACASFDMFVNYKDRGEQFKLWVKKLK